MSKVAEALLEFTLDSVASFVEPAPFLLVSAALDTIEEGWDRGEAALGEYLEQQGEAMQAQLVVHYQQKLKEMQAKFDERVEEIQREADAAIASRDASASAKLDELNRRFLQVVEAAELRVAQLQAEIDRLKAQLAEGQK